jgi:hypothetical protein
VLRSWSGLGSVGWVVWSGWMWMRVGCRERTEDGVKRWTWRRIDKKLFLVRT